MLLAIDVGNTQTVLGLFEDSRLRQTWRIATHPIESELSSWMKEPELASVQAIVIGSVVPEVTSRIQKLFESNPFGESNRLQSKSIPPAISIINSSWPFRFILQVESPERVGTDRLVNAEAAIRDYGYPCIIVDSGTATTICAVSKNELDQAVFLGGAIIPGLKLAMEALIQNTAQLFPVNLTPPLRAIGKNTDEALRSGLLFGYASMIDGMILKFQEELGTSSLPVIATGGVSHLMKGLLKNLTHFDAQLTLRGIAYLYESIAQQGSSLKTAPRPDQPTDLDPLRKNHAL